MSQLEYTIPLLAAIQADVEVAWAEMVDVWYNDPSIEEGESSLPYAVIELAEVADSFDGDLGGSALVVAQEHTFTIIGRWKFPVPVLSSSDTNPITFKVARCNLLSARLCAGPTYATYGYSPIITNREFREEDNPIDDTIGVRITFKVTVAVSHH